MVRKDKMDYLVCLVRKETQVFLDCLDLKEMVEDLVSLAVMGKIV